MAYQCPCCGQPLREQAPTESLRFLGLNQTQRRIVETLVRSFGEWIPTRRLVEAVYGDRPDGGPDGAENVISVAVATARPILAAIGLTIQGKHGAGRRVAFIRADHLVLNHDRRSPAPTRRGAEARSGVIDISAPYPWRS
jgi:hypothetical protein